VSTRQTWTQLVLCVSLMRSELLDSVLKFAFTRRRPANSMVKYRKFHRKRRHHSILVHHMVRLTGCCLTGCANSTNSINKSNLPRDNYLKGQVKQTAWLPSGGVHLLGLLYAYPLSIGQSELHDRIVIPVKDNIVVEN